VGNEVLPKSRKRENNPHPWPARERKKTGTLRLQELRGALMGKRKNLEEGSTLGKKQHVNGGKGWGKKKESWREHHSPIPGGNAS